MPLHSLFVSPLFFSFSVSFNYDYLNISIFYIFFLYSFCLKVVKAFGILIYPSFFSGSVSWCKSLFDGNFAMYGCEFTLFIVKSYYVGALFLTIFPMLLGIWINSFYKAYRWWCVEFSSGLLKREVLELHAVNVFPLWSLSFFKDFTSFSINTFSFRFIKGSFIDFWMRTAIDYSFV